MERTRIQEAVNSSVKTIAASVIGVRDVRTVASACRSAAGRTVWRRLSLRIVVGVDFGRAVFVRPAIDDRLEIEIAVARRAGGRPFQAVGVPRIAAGLGPEEDAVDEVDGEDDLRGAPCRWRSRS